MNGFVLSSVKSGFLIWVLLEGTHCHLHVCYILNMFFQQKSVHSGLHVDPQAVSMCNVTVSEVAETPFL